MISIIAAIARNGIIGHHNRLAWHLPADLKHFKRITMGKPMIMGRKTFESIGKPLPGRTTIVVTTHPNRLATRTQVAHTPKQALALGQNIAQSSGVNEVMIVGGACLYQAMLAMVDRMYITRIHADIEGDTYFPEVHWDNWAEASREDHLKTAENPFDYSFITYEKCFS